MDPHLLPKDLKDRRENESIEEEIGSNMVREGTREKAVEFTIRTKVSEAMGEGTDLKELYGEGKISRAELLQELRRRIPGGDSYPDELERQAWRFTALESDPTQVMAWAEELSILDEISRYLVENS